MNVPNPIVYWFCLNAWERYRRDENLSARSLPSLVPEYVETGIISRLLRALRVIVVLHKFAARAPQPGGLQQQAAYKGAH